MEHTEHVRLLQRLGPRGARLDEVLRKSFVEQDSEEYRKVNNFIVILIFLSITIMVFESVDSIQQRFTLFFDLSEYFVVGVFTLEYLGALYFGKLTNGSRLKYMVSFWGIIDLLAIMPTYLRIINLSALKAVRIFRILRFLRMLRVLKLAKHSADSVRKTKGKKVNTLKYDLQIYFFALISVVVVFGTLVYFAENGQNEQFRNIPASMWWCFVTITTVGYGDMYPVTVAGKLIAIPTMLSGLVLFGMLMNVIGKAMMDLLFGKNSEAETKPEHTGNLEFTVTINGVDTDPKKLELIMQLLKDDATIR